MKGYGLGDLSSRRNKTKQNKLPCFIDRSDWCSLCVSDSPIVTIGPGGLPLLVSHLFVIPILVLWVGLEKIVNNYTWIGEIIFRVTYTYLASLKIQI
jgi:hypothetical protein